jgi:hypothetical protein
MKHHATSHEVVGSKPNEVNEFAAMIHQCDFHLNWYIAQDLPVVESF